MTTKQVDACGWLGANLSLGGTTSNDTPLIFETHPNLGQHKTHIKKAFHS